VYGIYAMAASGRMQYDYKQKKNMENENGEAIYPHRPLVNRLSAQVTSNTDNHFQ
jgi:hypothetical protein